MYGWLYNSVSEFTQVVPIVCRVKNCCRPFVIFLKKLKFCKSWVRAWNNEKLNYENQHGLTKYRIECLNLKRNKLEYFQQACSKMEWCPHLFPPRVYLSISAISGSIMHLPWLPQWISFNHWWRDLKWFVTSGGEMSPSAWSAHQMRDGCHSDPSGHIWPWCWLLLSADSKHWAHINCCWLITDDQTVSVSHCSSQSESGQVQTWCKTASQYY